MQNIVGESRMNSLATFSNGPLYTDMQVLADQQELIYTSSVRSQDVVFEDLLEEM